MVAYKKNILSVSAKSFYREFRVPNSVLIALLKSICPTISMTSHFSPIRIVCQVRGRLNLTCPYYCSVLVEAGLLPRSRLLQLRLQGLHLRPQSLLRRPPLPPLPGLLLLPLLAPLLQKSWQRFLYLLLRFFNLKQAQCTDRGNLYYIWKM